MPTFLFKASTFFSLSLSPYVPMDKLHCLKAVHVQSVNAGNQSEIGDMVVDIVRWSAHMILCSVVYPCSTTLFPK